MSLIKSGSIVSLFTLFSRIAGLVRELFIAYSFGASATADSVNVAFKLPNLLRRIFGEGALSLVFIPIYNQQLVKSKQNAEEFASNIFWMLGIWLALITLVMELLMPQLMLILAPGFYTTPEKFANTIFLCRITTPYLIFVCLCALFGGILNSHRKFALFAFIPSLVSLMIIIFPIMTDGIFETDTAMAIGVAVAGIIQVSLMYVGAYRQGIAISLVPSIRFGKDTKKLVKNMVPASMTAGLMQINLFISQSIASFLPGAVAILSYAERLYQFPLSMIGIAFGTVLLPELSRLYKADALDKAIEIQNNAIKLGIFLSVAAAVGIMFLSYPIINIIYERGAFSSVDSNRTATTLIAFAVGLPAFALNKIFLPFFYARGDTRRPMLISVITVVINTISNIILMQFFGVVGIAAGSSIAAWCTVVIMYYNAHKQGFSLCDDFLSFILRTTLAIIAMTGSLYLTSSILLQDFVQFSLLYKLGVLGIIVSVSAVVYFATAYCAGLSIPMKMRSK